MGAVLLPSLEELNLAFSYERRTGRLRWKNRGNVSEAVNARDAGRLAGCLAGDGSRRVRLDGAFYAEHRVIWKMLTGNDPRAEIDHINGNPADNRITNLREATRSQNGANTRARGKWPKGVCFDKERGRFSAKMKVSGRTINLGRFSDPQSAARAYEIAAQKVWGEFTCTNR